MPRTKTKYCDPKDAEVEVALVLEYMKRYGHYVDRHFIPVINAYKFYQRTGKLTQYMLMSMQLWRSKVRI